MRVAVPHDYHRVFGADPAIQRLRRRVPVDVYTDKLPLERLRGSSAARPTEHLERRVSRACSTATVR